MIDHVGVDEFGREHFVLEAAPGRLGISLGENERGNVIVRGIDNLDPADMDAWDPVDQQRVQMLRQTVQEGDRLVAIEGQDIVHCSLKEVICRLGKLAAKKRRLTFGRYHVTGFKSKQFDLEKLVLARVPSGPLGLQINECIPYGAFVECFQTLPDGSMSVLARNTRIHRGCWIVNVNGADVSGLSRQEVITMLAGLKDQEKEVIFYRTTTEECTAMFSVESNGSERHLGFTLDENETSRCVVTSVGPRGHPSISPGDILIGVNATDLTCMNRKDAIDAVKEAPLPRTLYFARPDEQDHPECHLVSVEAGPLGLNLDAQQTDHARITGFTTAGDCERPEFTACASFMRGSYILAIGKLDVATHDLYAISGMLAKMKQSAKQILFGNAALLRLLQNDSKTVRIEAPGGALGIHFSGGHTDTACVSGFYPLTDGRVGATESSGRVPIGATLQRINSLNVSCMKLSQVIDLLKKLNDASKIMQFHIPDNRQDFNTRVIDIRVAPGPLGIDLKRSISNKVIVDKLNQNPTQGSTRVFDHGGVIEGSELVAIDGFDVTDLELPDVLHILKLLVAHEKVITFSTTSAAYEKMLRDTTRSQWKSVTMAAKTSIPFDHAVPDQAVVSREFANSDIPIGSKLVAIDNVDIRALNRDQVSNALKDLYNFEKTIMFDMTTCETYAPRNLKLATGASFNLSLTENAPPRSANDSIRGSQSMQDFAAANTLSSPMKLSSSTSDLPSSTPSLSPPGSPHRPAPLTPQKSIPGLVIPQSTAPLVPMTTAPLLPPTPTALAPLSIRPLEATLPGSSLNDVNKLLDAKQSQSSAAGSPTRSEFMINMTSWTGSRSLHRLQIDVQGQSLVITAIKATSPRPGRGSGAQATVLRFSELLALDCGGGSGGNGVSRGGLFRSGSATLNTDGTERATVVLTIAQAKKAVEFDMRSVHERDEFQQRLQQLVPTLKSA